MFELKLGCRKMLWLPYSENAVCFITEAFKDRTLHLFNNFLTIKYLENSLKTVQLETAIRLLGRLAKFPLPS